VNDSRLPHEFRSDAWIRATTARPTDATNVNRESSDAPARRHAHFIADPTFRHYTRPASPHVWLRLELLRVLTPTQ
jgi:hypothetical protein